MTATAEKAIVRRTAGAQARQMAAEAHDRKHKAVLSLRARAKSAPELLRIYHELSKEYASHAKGGLLFHWRLGRRAEEIQAKAKYGGGDIELLAEALGIDPSTVYRCRSLARMWPLERDFHRDVMDRALPDGDPVGVALLFAIVHLPEDSAADDIHRHRREMLELVFAEGLTLRALQAEIESRFPGGRPAESAKASKSSPKTVFGSVRQMAGASDKMARQIEDWAEQALGQIRGISASTLGAKKTSIMGQVSAGVESFTRLSYQAGTIAKELSTFRDTLEEKVK